VRLSLDLARYSFEQKPSTAKHPHLVFKRSPSKRPPLLRQPLLGECTTHGWAIRNPVQEGHNSRPAAEIDFVNLSPHGLVKTAQHRFV
jgi:hypothetical protein